MYIYILTRQSWDFTGVYKMAVSEEWELTSHPRNRFHLSLSKLTTVSLTVMPGATLLPRQ